MIEKIRKAVGQKEQRTLLDLIFGVLAINIIALLALIFVKDRLLYLLGIVLGTAVAVTMVVSMYKSICKAVLLDRKSAKTKMKFGTFFRLLMVMGTVALGALAATESESYAMLVGTIVSVISLKIAAIFQPSIDILVLKIFKKEE